MSVCTGILLIYLGFGAYVIDAYCLLGCKRLKFEKRDKIYSCLIATNFCARFGIHSPKIIHEYINVLYDYYNVIIAKVFYSFQVISGTSNLFIG